MSEELPLPVINADAREYWGATNTGRLLIRRCKTCGAKHFMPRHLCPSCWSEELEWIEASGRGTVYSFTVIHRAPLAPYAGRVPYVVAIVELTEGPRMLTNIVGDGALSVRIGDPVEVCFEQRNEQSIPQFKRI